MSQEKFVQKHRKRWREFERMVSRLEDGDLEEGADEFPARYRRICRHLAVARSRGYTPGVRNRLEKLVERGHTILYQRHHQSGVGRIWAYVAGGFARDVRQNWKFLAVAVAMFCIPSLALYGWIVARPEVAAEILGTVQLQELEAMYGSEEISRDVSDDLTMFAFYVNNNVGIALRTFGAGIAFGVGSLAVLIFNGVFIGAAAGYVTTAGLGDQFWPFVIGHASFELTAIVLAGMAGLKIGAAPIWPGRRGRIEALQKAAEESVGIVCGFAVMLLVAAFIEAFWSPRDLEPMIRYLVGGGLWVLVLSYFAFAGRRT